MRFVLRGGSPALDPTDPDLRLTDEQQAVFRDDREICLSAGAGAGKTHTLALRFVALLVRVAWTEARPERVLVLTFTEKAALEMAERCRARLFEAAEAAATADLALAGPERARWVSNLRRMAAGFDQACISTFHGFCAGLLREFPVQGETPPGATVLDPLLAEEVLDEALSAELDAWRDDRADDVLALLDTFGSRAGILAAATEVLGRRAVLGAALADAEAGRPTLAERIATATIGADEAARELQGRLLPSLRLVERLVSPSGGGPAAVAFREALAAAAPPSVDPLETWARLRTALEVWLTDRGTLRSLTHPTVMGTKRTWPDERRYAQAKAALEVLAGRLADVPALARRARTLPTPADRVLHEVLPRFAAFVGGAASRLDALLRARGALTFDGMQERAIAAVLGHRDLRVALRARHRWLMVDEFQDTDRRQWALVQALGRGESTVAEDRIFVVGDPKQAIYGFRGGDVTVFREAEEALGGALRLSRNFRSRPALIDWFNAVFPTVFGAGDEPWEARYDPLVAGRPDDGGTVVLLETLTPADAVADAVDDALRGGALSVAVLLRARTHQDRYEAALRRAGIPYLVPSGVGFWARQEVRDLVNALCAAALGDPIATLGWLRSPLGGCPDATVDALGGDGIRALADGEVPRAIPEVAERFRAARAELATLLPSVWLERRIVELAPAFERDEPSGRAVANGRRLVERLRPLDGRGAAAVARFARRAMDAGEREGEAPAEARSGVVLTTVHGAKGLEFDAVIVPELERRPPVHRSAVSIGRLGGRWTLAFAVDDPDADVQARATPGLALALRQQLRAEAEAEDRRLLYVAATRARDRLVLISAPATDPEPTAFPTWIQRVLPVLPRATSRSAPPRATPRVAPAPAAEAPPHAPPPRVRAIELSPSALGAVEAPPGPVPATADRVAVALAAVRGRVLHEVLEDGEEGDREAIGRRWRAAAREAGADDEALAAGARALHAAVTRLRALPEVRRALDARGHRELAFRVSRGPVTLQGRIDRLWWDDDAQGWVVLDWKSGRRDPAGTAARQLLAYGWAASRLVAEPVVRGEIVWAGDGEVEVLGPWTPASFEPIEHLLDAVGRPGDPSRIDR